MILSGIRAVAVYDPGSGTTVQIPRVVANSFEFSQRDYDSGERTATGSRRRTSDVSECRFQFFDSDGTLVQQLESWEGQTRCSLVATGSGVCVQWYEEDHFVIRRLPLGGLISRGDLYEIEFRREGHGRHNIWQQTNLLAHINGRGNASWQEDPSTDDIADGYTQQGSPTLAWVDLTNSQSVTSSSPDEGIYVDIVFPLQLNGFTFTLSGDIVEEHTDTNTATLRIEGKNYAGGNVATAEVDGAIGRQSTSISTGIMTLLYTIRVLFLTPTGVTTSDDVVGDELCLRMDGGTTFIDN